MFKRLRSLFRVLTRRRSVVRRRSWLVSSLA
jgi:hypothetical protein